MARALTEVLAPTHLLNIDLVASFLTHHLGGHAGPGNLGLADLDAPLAGNEQDVVKRNRIARLSAVAEIDLNLVARRHLILTPIGSNNRVHRLAHFIRIGKPHNLNLRREPVEAAESSFALPQI